MAAKAAHLNAKAARLDATTARVVSVEYMRWSALFTRQRRTERSGREN